MFRKWREWLLLAMSISATLLVAELFCRSALPTPGFAALDENWLPGAIRPHPRRMYELTPNFAKLFTGGTYKGMWLTTNAMGLREPPLERVASSEVRILALGDSFTFGTGIDREATWPVQLERALMQRLPNRQLAIVNAGVPGYGLAQMRDMAEELLPQIKPQLLILAVYDGGFDRLLDPFIAVEDFAVRSSWAKRLRVVDGGVIISDHSPALAPFDLWIKSHWHFGARVYDASYKLLKIIRNLVFRRDSQVNSDEAVALEAGLVEIGKLNKIAKNMGVPLLVLLVNSFDNNNKVNLAEKANGESAKSFCVAEGIQVADPTAVLGDATEPLRLNESDNHWTTYANLKVAEFLTPYVIHLLKDKR